MCHGCDENAHEQASVVSIGRCYRAHCHHFRKNGGNKSESTSPHDGLWVRPCAREGMRVQGSTNTYSASSHSNSHEHEYFCALICANAQTGVRSAFGESHVSSPYLGNQGVPRGSSQENSATRAPTSSYGIFLLFPKHRRACCLFNTLLSRDHGESALKCGVLEWRLARGRGVCGQLPTPSIVRATEALSDECADPCAQD